MLKYVKSRNTVKAALILIPSIFMLIWFIAPTSIGILNAGNIFGIGFCMVSILLWILYPLIIRKKFFRILLRIFLGFVITGGLWAAFLSVNMLFAMGNSPKGADAKDYTSTIIILGCQVKNGYPSQMLVQRLAAACDFMETQEAVTCVTTGGYGANESVSEAEVAKNWLLRRNVDESRIFLEDTSKNTYENLVFAKEIVSNENLSGDVIIVSDGFHLWRATMTAKGLFDTVQVIPAETKPVSALPTYWVREWFALTRDFLTIVNRPVPKLGVSGSANGIFVRRGNFDENIR